MNGLFTHNGKIVINWHTNYTEWLIRLLTLLNEQIIVYYMARTFAWKAWFPSHNGWKFCVTQIIIVTVCLKKLSIKYALLCGFLVLCVQCIHQIYICTKR